MTAEGLASLFPLEPTAVMGFGQIPLRIRTYLRQIRETAGAVVSTRPDILVIIDSPEFTHRIARRVRQASGRKPDRRLRLALRLGLAAVARARHAALYRSCDGCFVV